MTKTIVITGASDGIGAAAGRELVKQGKYFIKRKVATPTALARDAKLATTVWNDTLKLLDATNAN